jgi:hypothetical protein
MRNQWWFERFERKEKCLHRHSSEIWETEHQNHFVLIFMVVIVLVIVLSGSL